MKDTFPKEKNVRHNFQANRKSNKPNIKIWKLSEISEKLIQISRIYKNHASIIQFKETVKK